MRMSGLAVFFTVVLLCAAQGVLGQTRPVEETVMRKAAVNQLTSEGLIRQWLVVGPFPNPELATPLPDGVVRKGYHEDYLKALGGEVAAELTPGQSIAFVDEQGAEQSVTVREAGAGEEGFVNFNAGPASMVTAGGSGAGSGAGVKVAYAFCWIDSPVEQKVYFHFGSDDAAKVWVNHQAVHTLWTLQRGAERWGDNFAVQLHAGLNPVLVKVDNRGGGWEFVLEVYDEAENQKKLDERFLSDIGAWEIIPGEGQGFVFAGGSFPMLQWKDQERIERLVGPLPIKVRWFDRGYNEVTLPTAPGRYAALVEAKLPEKFGGVTIRRGLTFVNMPGLTDRTQARMGVKLEYPGQPFNEQAWREQQGEMADYVSWRLMPWMIGQESGAVLAAAMLEMRPQGRPAGQVDNPSVKNVEFQLGLKRKLMGIDAVASPLKMPAKKEGKPAPVLHTGSEAQAGMKEGTAAKLKVICDQWYAASERPFAVIVARRGVIVYQGAFGEIGGKPVSMDTRFELASITKTLAAQMFAQFVSQGVIGLDDPVGKFLPDFPTQGEKAITFRGCFEFVSGYQGHGLWGGLDNAWLENAMAAQLPVIHPNVESHYSGMGHDLAAKAMEVVSGKSFIRLIQENYFAPLGIEEATILDASFGTQATTMSLAKMSQLILNKGSYGELEFYSPEVFEAMLPTATEPFFPQVHDRRGVGLYQLAPGVVGGAAASSTLQWIDLDRDLIVVVGRIIQGKDYDKYVQQLIGAVNEGVAAEAKDVAVEK